VGLLDRFRVAGVIATWWGDVQSDLRSIAAQGFGGYLTAVSASLRAQSEASEEKDSKVKPPDLLQDRIVRLVLPDRLDDISEQEGEIARLSAEVLAFEAPEEESDDESVEESDTNYAKELTAELKQLKAATKEPAKRLKQLEKGERSKGSIAWYRKRGEDVATLETEREELRRSIGPRLARIQSIEEELAPYKKTKSELNAAKKRRKILEAGLLDALDQAIAALDDSSSRDLVLSILRADLDAILARYVADHRQQVVTAFENWWDKYRVTLTSIEQDRDAATGKLHEYLGGLGYA
jgi:type I restriction enzyme M protein